MPRIIDTEVFHTSKEVLDGGTINHALLTHTFLSSRKQKGAEMAALSFGQEEGEKVASLVGGAVKVTTSQSLNDHYHPVKYEVDQTRAGRVIAVTN